MKIGFLLKTINNGGAERAFSLLANALVDLGHTVTICVFKKQIEYKLSSKVQVYSLARDSLLARLPFLGCLSRMFAFINYPKSYQCDIVVIPDLISVEVILGLLLSKQKFIFAIRNNSKSPYASWHLLRRLHCLFMCFIATGIYVQNNGEASALPSFLYKKMFILPNITEPEFFDICPARNPTIRKFVTAGRLCTQKNHRLLIDAFYMLVKEMQLADLHLTIYGRGNLESELTKQIDDLNMQDYISLGGYEKNIVACYKQADAFVFSSNFEGIGNALVEAMTVGVPSISTDCDFAPRNSITDGENGLLVPCNDVNALKSAMKRFVLDVSLAHRLGDNAKESMKDKGLAEPIAKEFIRQCNGILYSERESFSHFAHFHNLFEKMKKYITSSNYRFEIIACHTNLYNNMDDAKFLKKMYKIKFGKELNLENPKTYSEKLQWLKLYNRQNKYTMMVDKFEVKKYIAEQIGTEYVIPTLGVWNRFEDIDFAKLPNQFVLKCTHDSGSFVICRDKTLFDFKNAKKKLTRALKRNFYYWAREWQYKNILPRIIAEKYIIPTHLPFKAIATPDNYRFFCFNGDVRYVLVNKNTETTNETMTYCFDRYWNQILFFQNESFSDNTEKMRPSNFKTMLSIAEKLSFTIPFVRVDLFNVDGHIYFNELTFSPSAGYARGLLDDINHKMGSLIDLSLAKND